MLGTQHNCNSRNELKGNLWDRYMWLFTSGGGRHVPGICLAPNKSKVRNFSKVYNVQSCSGSEIFFRKTSKSRKEKELSCCV